MLEYYEILKNPTCFRELIGVLWSTYYDVWKLTSAAMEKERSFITMGKESRGEGLFWMEKWPWWHREKTGRSPISGSLDRRSLSAVPIPAWQNNRRL